MGYLSRAKLAKLGLGSFGEDVLISDLCSIHGASALHLGNHVRIDDFAVITAGARVEIGSHIHIGAHVFISGMNGLRMGDFSGISSGSTIFTSADDLSGAWLTGPTVPGRFRAPKDGPVVLGRHALVAAHSIVMPGVTIGEGTV